LLVAAFENIYPPGLKLAAISNQLLGDTVLFIKNMLTFVRGRLQACLVNPTMFSWLFSMLGLTNWQEFAYFMHDLTNLVKFLRLNTMTVKMIQ
jgi:hypothetical protein